MGADNNSVAANPGYETKYTLKVGYSFGKEYLLPSLRSNSNLDYDKEKNYSNIQINLKTKLTQNISYSGILELSDKPHELIGTKYSRPDFLITTGRFQESKIEYQSKSFMMHDERHYKVPADDSYYSRF